MDIVTFLRVRLDEDEVAAREALSQPGLTYRHTGSLAEEWKNSDYLTGGVSLSPERQRAEVESKRQMLAWLDRLEGAVLDANLWSVEVDDARKLLALPFAAHPDYNPAWRP